MAAHKLPPPTAVLYPPWHHLFSSPESNLPHCTHSILKECSNERLSMTSYVFHLLLQCHIEVCKKICLHNVKKRKLLISFKIRLHDTIYRLRFYPNSLIYVLSLSNSHNNVAPIQKNRGEKSHCAILVFTFFSYFLNNKTMHLNDTIRDWAC